MKQGMDLTVKECVKRVEMKTREMFGVVVGIEWEGQGATCNYLGMAIGVDTDKNCVE